MTRKKINLNDVEPEVDAGICGEFREQVTYRDAMVDVFFDNLPSYLCERIAEAHFVAGCMAWLTHRRVLGALANLPGGCQIVVQKEDWLRPGAVSNAELRAMYSRLSCPDRCDLPTRTAGGLAGISYGGDPRCEPVRCMGICHPRGHNGPRMHHKFLVFCDRAMSPYAVWTGSFNATENGEMSRENAVYIRSFSVGSTYAVEWSRTLALSEPLDWNHHYVEPEWRFGS